MLHVLYRVTAAPFRSVKVGANVYNVDASFLDFQKLCTEHKTLCLNQAVSR